MRMNRGQQPMNYRLISYVVLLWCMFVLPVKGLAQTGRDSTQLVPVALSLRGVGRVEFDVITVGSRAYIPITTVFKFLRLNIQYTRSQNLVEGFFLRADNPYRLDGAARTAIAGEKSLALTATDFVIRAEDFYLRQELYESLFGLKLRYDPRRLEVMLDTKVPLPVFVERAREAARRRRFTLGVMPTPDYTLSRGFVPFGFGRLDYGFVTQVSQHGMPRYTYSAHTGSQFLGGDLDTRVNGTVNEPLTFDDDVSARLRYAFLEGSIVRQLVFGDVLAFGLLPTNVFGAEITNRPAPRRYFFATEELEGNVPGGSVSDLYLGGALIDYQRVDESGRFSFPSTLTYGVSRFNVRNYDSTGIEQRTEYHLIVPPSMIPPGEIQYDIIGGKIRPLKNNEYYGNADVHWGVNSHLTIGAGIDYYSSKRLALTRKLHPMLTATTRITQLLIGDFVFSPTAFSRSQLSLTLPSNAGGTLVYTRYANQPFFNPRKIVEEATAAVSIPSFGEGYRVSLDVIARQTIFTAHRQRVIQPSLSGQVGIFSPRITHRRVYDWRYLPNDPTLEAVTTLSVGIRAPAQFLFRGTARYYHYDHGFRDVRLELSKRFSREIWLQIFYDRSIIAQTSIAGIQFVYYFPFTLLRTIIGVGSGGYRASQSVSGSVGYSQETGDFYLDYFSNRVGFGGMVLQPFVDGNANGIQDPGEENITKATIHTRNISGSQYLRYSPNFGFALRHTLPYEEYIISIDQQSLDNPLWVPRYNNFAVISEPNQFRQVQLPIIVGGVVRGKVELQTDGKTLPAEGIGITIQAVDSVSSGTPFKASTNTFSTGEFEFIAVPPGNYIVVMNERLISDLGYKTSQLSHTIEVQAKPDGDEINDVNFFLVK